MAGEVGGSERVCLLPAHKEAFPAELTLQTQEVHRQPASLSLTGLQSSNFRNPLCNLWCWQLLSLLPVCTVTPGMAVEGNWGAWKRGGFAAFSVGLAGAASVWKILAWAQTSPDEAWEEKMCLASLLHCLVLSRWLEKVKEGGEHMP